MTTEAEAPCPTVVVYCDGGAAVRRTTNLEEGTGAAAFAFRLEGQLIYGVRQYDKVTNNQMELQAAIQALKIVKAKTEHLKDVRIIVRSDSQYVVRGITEWIGGWQKRNWRTAKGDPVANRKIWEELYEIRRQMWNVKFEWVRGHSGIEMNEFVDSLASKAMKEREPIDWIVTVL